MVRSSSRRVDDEHWTVQSWKRLCSRARQPAVVDPGRPDESFLAQPGIGAWSEFGYGMRQGPPLPHRVLKPVAAAWLNIASVARVVSRPKARTGVVMIWTRARERSGPGHAASVLGQKFAGKSERCLRGSDRPS